MTCQGPVMPAGLNGAPAPGAPYLLTDSPRSGGRVLLSRVLADMAAIEWGFGPEEIAAVFDRSVGARASGNGDRAHSRIRLACGNLLDLILSGRLRTSSRPFGGGVPRPMGSDLWELDDPMPRFAVSAFDPGSPFDPTAAPTHWILADAEDLDAIVGRLCGASQVSPTASPHRPDAEVAPDAAVDGSSAGSPPVGGLLRLPAVLARTGLSRSTLYDKIEKRTFPRQIALGSRLSVWREQDVDAWVADPR